LTANTLTAKTQRWIPEEVLRTNMFRKTVYFDGVKGHLDEVECGSTAAVREISAGAGGAANERGVPALGCPSFG
jgi:hypothetical protein